MKTNTVANLIRILAIVPTPGDWASKEAHERLLAKAVDAAKVSIFDHTVEAMAANDSIVKLMDFPTGPCYDEFPNRYGIGE